MVYKHLNFIPFPHGTSSLLILIIEELEDGSPLFKKYFTFLLKI